MRILRFTIVLLFIFHCLLFTVSGQVAKRDSDKIRFDVILTDGSVFHGGSDDNIAYIVTEYSSVRIKLSDIDTVDIGILPYYLKEKKIVRLMRDIACNIPTCAAKSKRSYEKLISMKIGALPIIRKYVENEKLLGIKNDTFDAKYNEANVLKVLIAKYKLSKDFMDRDIICINSGFKIGGIFTSKKRRAFIKLGGYSFSREVVKRIIFFR